MSWNPLSQPMPITIRGRLVRVLPEDPKPAKPTPEQLEQLAKARAEASAMGRKGEANPQAKLTEQKVLSIRRRYADGARKSDLARLYCVSEKLIFMVVRRHIWKHVM